VTVVEMLVVASILAVIAGVGVARWPGFDFARAFASQVVAARFEAIVTGRWVSLGVRPCPGAEVPAAPDGPTRIVAFPIRGLMFGPDGLPRTCDGGGVGNATIVLEYRGRRAAVIVSSLGRVR